MCTNYVTEKMGPHLLFNFYTFGFIPFHKCLRDLLYLSLDLVNAYLILSYTEFIPLSVSPLVLFRNVFMPPNIRTDEMATKFPQITNCTSKFHGTTGMKNSFDAECVLGEKKTLQIVNK